MSRNHYYVYIMSNTSRTFYTDVTNDIRRHVYEHKNKLLPGFTCRYNINQLVYFEETGDIHAALASEKEF